MFYKHVLLSKYKMKRNLKLIFLTAGSVHGSVKTNTINDVVPEKLRGFRDGTRYTCPALKRSIFQMVLTKV